MRNRSNRAGRTNSFGCSSFSFCKRSADRICCVAKALCLFDHAALGRSKGEGTRSCGGPEGKRRRIQSATRFCKADKPNAQEAAKAAPQRIYVPLKNSRLTAYRMGIRVKSTAYGSTLPIASMAAVTRNGLTPHRYAPRKYSVSFSATAGSRSPST